MSATLVEAKANGGFESVKGACAALCLPRSTWYRHQNQGLLPDPDIQLRDQIQKIALARTVYGYRRMTAELGRSGVVANHKRVLRIMREDNLLCLRKRRFIATTDSDHGLPVYPNLVAGLLVERINQLWVSDITYIRLRGEFIYLAVILDAFSRRVIGWELSRRIDTELTLAALRMALRIRHVQPVLIHHSDRGVQYAAVEYTGLLRESSIAISMSRRGNPYDNAQAESFMKTLKYEEVYLSEYANLTEARSRIGHFLEQVYNRERLHSRLGYVPPEEFEIKLPGFNQPTIC
jgi:transposase InsO family protein